MVKQRELQSFLNTVQITSKDTGMEFAMDKCSTVHIKNGEICNVKDAEMPDGQRMKHIEKSGYKYIGIIQDSEIKTYAMKDKIRTKYLRRVRKLVKSELYARNVFMRVN